MFTWEVSCKIWIFRVYCGGEIGWKIGVDMIAQNEILY